MYSFCQKKKKEHLLNYDVLEWCNVLGTIALTKLRFFFRLHEEKA
jgi:hypothetical protein